MEDRGQQAPTSDDRPSTSREAIAYWGLASLLALLVVAVLVVYLPVLVFGVKSD